MAPKKASNPFALCWWDLTYSGWNPELLSSSSSLGQVHIGTKYPDRLCCLCDLVNECEMWRAFWPADGQAGLPISST